jgi:tRNA nucleotidyltransferase (CCA-adding enzyme)
MSMPTFPPKPIELVERVVALPAARPLLARLPDDAGVHLVGGAVRDLLLGGAPVDLDLVVEGDARAVAASLGGELKAFDRFGTATVVLDGHSYDIARARRETYAYPGALPDVEPAPLAEDLLRRDFTVNALALALALAGAHAGELSAAPAALEDLHTRRLRVLHDRSFIDDPTRLMRLARYASRLGFEVEPHTRELADAAVAGGALGTVSRPRLGAELRLLAREPDPIRALRGLDDLGLGRAIHPAFGIEDDELARRALAVLPDDEGRDRLALAVAARGVPPDELVALLESLAFEAEDRDAILLAATRADDVARALHAASAPSAVAAAAAGAPAEVVALAGALGADTQARAWLDTLRHVRLAIDGSDLLAAGVPEGPAIGRGLRAALAAKLDGQVSGRREELAAALTAAVGTTGR